ncbi:MAG: 2-amino-4-hydroxy-6-hydroxymethyldihydropteridine diphosphokinase [Clostridia bacterium]|nr:2-amino-4-hydroxy-6-hydroxymethyldihydropteridine diphosphokinase [Clostridia bacterium]
MNTIEIRGLEVSACHGVLDFEKVKPQKFIFDAKLTVDFLSALKNDDISATVNYAEVCALIEKITKENKFNLIEKLALECAFSILENFGGVQKVVLTCFKPEAPLPQKFENVSVTVELERVKAYLSIGSSMGDRQANLYRAIKLLGETRGISIEKVSAFIETEPYGGVAKNKFLNGAVSVTTFLPPHALLDEIHRIEKACGRVRKKRWDDRTLDIDIIFYGDKTICDETLIIPHPDYMNRDFVKIPLKSIAPHKLT